MTNITGTASGAAEQHLNSVENHLHHLRELITAGELPVSHNSLPDCAESESVVIETFGRWVLDLLGLDEGVHEDAVRQARVQLVGALSKSGSVADQTGSNGTANAWHADDDSYFVDVFAEDDLADAPDDELGVKPISYEA
jgi:hypothetical protein